MIKIAPAIAAIILAIIMNMIGWSNYCHAKFIRINKTTIAEMIKLKKFTISDNISFKGGIKYHEGKITKVKLIINYKIRY